MREKVGGHERTVAVPADGHALGIGDTAAHEFVDGGLRAGNKLGHVSVVGFLFPFADDRHGGIVEHRIAEEQIGQGTAGAHAHEAMGRAANLARGIGALEFARVGPQQSRQRTRGGRPSGR